jgi:hypothetical protein
MMKVGRPRPFPVGQCTKCGVAAVYRTNLNTYYCGKHYRFSQMTRFARTEGKTVPTEVELESLLPGDMSCPVCRRLMNWLAKDGKATQITLQHDRDGTHRLICLGCNSRHAQLPGDLLYQLTPGQKYCHGCKTIKSLGEFHRTNSKSVPVGRNSRCKLCTNAAHRDWVERNREHVTEYQRKLKSSRQERR